MTHLPFFLFLYHQFVLLHHVFPLSYHILELHRKQSLGMPCHSLNYIDILLFLQCIFELVPCLLVGPEIFEVVRCLGWVKGLPRKNFLVDLRAWVFLI